jgi:PD-(D/E)XK nuclease superfamily
MPISMLDRHFDERPTMDISGANTLLAAVKPLVLAAEEIEALLRRKLGTAFRYADYAVRRSEVPLNRVLCDLLDPRGPHGQSGAFLDLFLKILRPDFSVGATADWNVRLNFPTSSGRFVDLVLRDRRGTVVALECKPWADESENQLEDYAVYLLGRFDPEKVWLLFLPGKLGRENRTLSEITKARLQDRFVTLPFERAGDGRSIVEWLEKCAGLCEADKVARFISDLTEYLDSEFSSLKGGQPMSDSPGTKAMVAFVSTTADYIKAAFDIEEAMPELRLQAARTFVKEIEHELAREAWEIHNSFAEFSKREHTEYMTYRRPHWPPGWGICLGQWEPMHAFYIGLYCPANETALSPKDVSDIRSAMGRTLLAINKDKSQKEWPAFTDLPKPFDDWRRADAIALLKGLNRCDDGRTALQTVVEWFRELGSVAEPVLDSILSRRV